MAMSPQYDNKWKVIPYARDGTYENEKEMRLGGTWGITWDGETESIEDTYGARTTKWIVIAQGLDKTVAEHIAQIHNEWHDNYLDQKKFFQNLPGRQEYCG